LSAPGLSCLVPQQLFGADKSDCCRQMGDRCGSMNTSSPKSCCQSPRQGSQPFVSSTSHLQLDSAPSMGAVLPMTPSTAVLDVKNSVPNAELFHSPPVSPPEAVSVLRI
jgi:hypothetical protein